MTTSDSYRVKGSVIGAALLVAGTSIGAGMLALPIKAGGAGFVPFIVYFLIAWVYMTGSGLILLEANLFFDDEVNLVSMAQKTLGKIGKYIAIFTFCFLFYSLITAYITASTSLILEVIESFCEIVLPFWLVALSVAGFFTLFVYIGVGLVDRINRLFMIGLILSYLLLVVLGLPYINKEFLSTRYWSIGVFALPVMVIMFGFQNLVPTLCTYLDKNVKKMVLAILSGSFFSFLICLCWVWIILGIVPVAEIKVACDQGNLATQALQTTVNNGSVTSIAQLFSFFAIITSCLGIALSFVDFLADGLKLIKSKRTLFFLCITVMLPPYFFSLTSPRVFFVALDMAGGFATVILFGILPVCMVWRGRYRFLWKKPLLPGGRFFLSFIFILSIGIFFLELFQEMGLISVY